ncbi:hypothetical protein [Pacificibacter marinus]|uniref:hypothetical protein n=1 Tax=Pacificibacter marinus TaxID=658057 RepID=UPI001C074867|nr:hypothetical protein [Pacificibacter marinus]MBU2868946.1 hypothetical protein [Pacificibacter marinus]
MDWTQRRVNSEKLSTCERCGLNTQLRKSHAIPDAFFRDLKRSGKGKVTKIHQDFGPRPSSESGWSYILCAQCEMHFNASCDEAAILFVKHTVSKSQLQAIDHSTLALFICSVLWRAQLSSASMYGGYKITKADVDQISSAALGRCDPFMSFSFEVAQLHDEDGNISINQIRKTIAAPYRTEVKIGSNLHTIHYFVAGGVFFSALSPKVPSIVLDHRYLVQGARDVPRVKRSLSSLSNFRKIEAIARREAGSSS